MIENPRDMSSLADSHTETHSVAQLFLQELNAHNTQSKPIEQSLDKDAARVEQQIRAKGNSGTGVERDAIVDLFNSENSGGNLHPFIDKINEKLAGTTFKVGHAHQDPHIKITLSQGPRAVDELTIAHH